MQPSPEPEPSSEPLSEFSSESSKLTIIEKLNKIKQAVWVKRPILEDIVAKRSNKSLYEYAQEFTDINPVPVLSARRSELFEVVQIY